MHVWRHGTNVSHQSPIEEANTSCVKTDEQINVVEEVEQQLVTGQHFDSTLPSPRFTNQLK